MFVAGVEGVGAALGDLPLVAGGGVLEAVREFVCFVFPEESLGGCGAVVVLEAEVTGFRDDPFEGLVDAGRKVCDGLHGLVLF